LRHTHNGEAARMSRNAGRQASRARKRALHTKLDNGIDDLRDRIATTAEAHKSLKAALKDLTTQKRDAGRTPKHNRAGSSKFDGVKIPKLALQASGVSVSSGNSEGSAISHSQDLPDDPDFTNPFLDLDDHVMLASEQQYNIYHPALDMPDFDVALYHDEAWGY